nr:SPASM domain-containing protein [uncultured Rhodopila sp.]
MPACCLDHAAVHEFGNVGKQSMLEIFNGPLAAKFRSVHLKRARRNLAMCATCNVGEFWADRSKPGQAERETRFIAAERQVEVSGRTGRMIR